MRSVGGHSADSEGARRVRQLIEHAQDMVYRVALVPRRTVEYVSAAAQAITGHAPEEFYADPQLVMRAVHPDDAHHVSESLRDPSHLKNPMLLRWVHDDGRIVWAEHQRVAVYDSAGTLVAIEGVARDVTQRIESERRLMESEEQMRQLVAHVQSAREQDRVALARELHDELGQTLTAIKLELARTAEALKAERTGRQTVDRLQSLAGLVDIGISTVKRITMNLRPPTLDHLGLAAAIRWDAMTFRARTGLRCHIRGGRDTTALSAEQQTVVFRIFQEALTNVARHARASAVHVSLAERKGLFEMRIRDNGRGITDAQITDPRSIGLIGMRERTVIIGGTFQIAGSRAKGTVITVRVPTPKAAKRS